MNVKERGVEFILAALLSIGIVALVGICFYFFLILYMVYRGGNYIPTPSKDITTALSVLRPGDTFIDLGFGNGEVMAAALRKDATKVIGYELDPVRFFRVFFKFYSQFELHFADIWSADLSKAQVIYTFFTIIHMKNLYLKAKKEMKRGGWFISYVHPIPGVYPTKKIGKVLFYKM